MNKITNKILLLMLSLCMVVTMAGCGSNSASSSSDTGSVSSSTASQSASSNTVNSDSVGSVPKYSGEASITINNNVPKFTKKQLASAKSYQKYGKLDNYGRATSCIACIGKEIMPTTKRGGYACIMV